MKLHFTFWKKIQLVLTVIILTSSPIFSQSAAPKPFRFRLLSWEGAVDGIYYSNGGKSVAVNANDYTRSPFYDSEPSDKLTFFKMVPGLDGKTVKEIVAETDVRDKGSILLILLAKTPDGKIQANVSNDEPGIFPKGSYRFINATKRMVYAAIGSSKAAIQPGQYSILKSEPDPANQGVHVRVAIQADTTYRAVYSDVWRWVQDDRTLIFAFETGNPQVPIELKRITENARFDPPAATKDQKVKE